MARLLVIDDEMAIRYLVRLMLEGAGHEVVEAVDGVMGLELYSAHTFDLVITDLLMPRMDGFETIAALRKITPDVKILVISGGERLRLGKAVSGALSLDTVRTLAKPFTREELLTAVEDTLR